MSTVTVSQNPFQAAFARRGLSKDQHAPPPQGARPKTPKARRPNTTSGLTVVVVKKSPAAIPLSSPGLGSGPTRRPLPTVPSIVSMDPTPPPSPPPVAGPSSCRPRPLPRPPSSCSVSDDRDSGDDTEESASVASLSNISPPIARTPRQAAKPLPVPVGRTTPKRPIRNTPTKTVPLVDELDVLTPKWSVMASRSQTAAIFHSISTVTKISFEPTTPTPLSWVSAGKASPSVSSTFESPPRFVLNFTQSPVADNSDAVSEGSEYEYDHQDSIHPRCLDEVDYPAPTLRRIGEESLEDPDYSWVLQDDILYRQKAHDVTFSKWYTEKRGKRITEKDYESIRSALRSL